MGKKNKASDRVSSSRYWALDDLKISCGMLVKEANHLLKKIEEEGVDGRYSVNSDVLRWARRAHSACYRLSILHECEVLIDSECGIIEQLEEQLLNVTQDQAKPVEGPSGEGSTETHASDCRDGEGEILQGERRPEAVETATSGSCEQETQAE